MIGRWDPGLFVNYYHDASNPSNFQQANLWLFPVCIFFTDGSSLSYSIFPSWQNINFNFAPLGIQIEQDEYYYTRHEIRFITDQPKKWSLSGGYEWGDFYNGRRQTGILEFELLKTHM